MKPFLSLVMVAALAAGCAGYYPTPPPPPTLDGLAMRRFDRVSDELYRSSQPTHGQLVQMVERYHIRTVIQLNAPRDVAPPGVVLHYLPFSALYQPPAALVQKILDLIDSAEKPVLIHCYHGEDRTGLLVALHRIRRGATVDDAYLDMLKHGFHPFRGVWRAWRQAVGWDTVSQR